MRAFAQSAMEIQANADDMKAQFLSLNDGFAKFTGIFGTFASQKIVDDRAKLDELNKEIKDVQDNLTKVTIAMNACIIGLATTLPVTGE
jgi:archaellum component FlaC